jgi:hypothetical protein
MRWLTLLVVLLLVFVAGWAIWSYVWAGDVGSTTAVCPGPDYFGYTCDTSGQTPYQSAQYDTFLYADDDYILLELPFPFTFYGQPQTHIQAHVNGVLRFGESDTDALLDNVCLPESAGELIAPYWDDLDLTVEGFLQIEAFGEAPNRMAVLEWYEVPLLANPAQKVTFAVQLFEGSNDILFLYEDVPTAGSATIGIASGQVGSSLTVGCNETTAVSNGTQIRFVYPEEPNTTSTARLPSAHFYGTTWSSAQADVQALSTAVARSGENGLIRLRTQWSQQTPSRKLTWQWQDVNADGTPELQVLVQGAQGYPQLTQVLVLGQDGQVWWRMGLHGRGQPETHWTLLPETSDLLLQNGTGTIAIYHWHNQTYIRQDSPLPTPTK